MEGRQAAIYEVEPKHDHEKWFPGVLKVFKAGYLLRDLQNQWPITLLHKFAPSNERGGDLHWTQCCMDSCYRMEGLHSG